MLTATIRSVLTIGRKPRLWTDADLARLAAMQLTIGAADCLYGCGAYKDAQQARRLAFLAWAHQTRRVDFAAAEVAA